MSKQNGMTLIGMLFVVAVVIMLGIVSLRVVPVYFQHYSIVQSIKTLNSTSSASLTGDQLADVDMMKKNIEKRLDVNGIYDFKMENVEFTPLEGNKYLVKLKYHMVRPLVYNVSLMFEFNDSIEVHPGSEE